MKERQGIFGLIQPFLNTKSITAFILGISLGMNYHNTLSSIKDYISGRNVPVEEKFIQSPYNLEIERTLNKQGKMELFLELPDSTRVPLYKDIGEKVGELYGNDR
tara:strand:+ start:192 stop:506 length:315 start_codon:yes stop_codon:yes gene_type:complete